MNHCRGDLSRGLQHDNKERDLYARKFRNHDCIRLQAYGKWALACWVLENWFYFSSFVVYWIEIIYNWNNFMNLALLQENLSISDTNWNKLRKSTLHMLWGQHSPNFSNPSWWFEIILPIQLIWSIETCNTTDEQTPERSKRVMVGKFRFGHNQRTWSGGSAAPVGALIQLTPIVNFNCEKNTSRQAASGEEGKNVH